MAKTKKASKSAEFVELTLPGGLRILIVYKDILQVWETDVPGEVLLKIVEHDDYIRVLYPWVKIKELLPATNHCKRPSRAKKRVSRDTGLTLVSSRPAQQP